jgi:CPA1 family monovalent cation:H+ antiporter
LNPDLTFVALFAIATAVAITARRVNVPYTVALVVVGLALGAARLLSPPHLTKELLYAVFLPGLLFEAAFHLEYRELRANAMAVTVLAVPGLIAALAVTAAILAPALRHAPGGEGFTAAQGAVFAAAVAATDPVAVVGLFKNLGAPKRLTLLVEAESLFNDGTAIVVFGIVLGMIGGSWSFGLAAWEFVRVVGLGLGIGLASSFAASRVIRRLDDPMLEITLTTIAAYGSFALAETVGGSGVIATVAAGMVCGNYAAKSGMGEASRLAVQTFWEYVAFALNSLVFLLIGFEVPLASLVRSWPLILLAYAAVTAGRLVMIFAVTALLRPTRERLGWSWAGILTWGGLRGALSMVLVLALPQEFPNRELVVTMVFGVVILTILVQGTTMTALMRRLKVC